MRYVVLAFFLSICGLVLADTTNVVPPEPVNVEERRKVVVPESLVTVPELREVQERAKIVPPESLATPPDLQEVEGRRKIVPEEDILVSPSPLDVQEREKIVVPESALSVPSVFDVREKEKNIPQEQPLEQPSFQAVQPRQPMSVPYGPLEIPNLGAVAIPEIAELNDFSGGLNLVSHPTHVAKNQAVELINMLWNPQGEGYVRPGYSLHSTPPEALNFLYRYYRQNADALTMGGSDTALYFGHPDTSGDGWTYLIGTGGVSGRWDGTTYEDMFVGTHEDITPVIWNGSTLVEIGTSIDSFEITSAASSCGPEPICCPESVAIVFAGNYGWEDNKWREYLLGFWANNDGPVKDGCVQDTIYYKNLILSSGPNWVKIRPSQFLLASWPNWNSDVILGSYARIYSWFGIENVWRTGQIDSSVEICTLVNPLYDYPLARLYDDDFVWDSLFNYEEWIFEVTAGKGIGQKNFLMNLPCNFCGLSADTSSFFIAGFCYSDFDSTTQYKIYKPNFLGEGAKFCEVFDARLWLAWTGLPQKIEYTEEVFDSSYAGEDTSIASIDTSVASVDTTCGDSLLFQGNLQYANSSPCSHCSTKLVFAPVLTPNAHADSAVRIPIRVYSDTSELVYDTLTRYVRVEDNNNTVCFLTSSSSPCAEGQVLYEYPWTYYAIFYSIDTTGTLWREGTVDSATNIGATGTWLEDCHTRLWDGTYTWEDTVSYNYYYLIIDSGKGAGIKTFLFNYVACPACSVTWNDSGFLVPNYSPDCFDNTSHYKIYTPTLTATCEIETTFSYDTTFAYDVVWDYYDTTITDTIEDLSNQNKNCIIWSELNDLGNWPPENFILIEAGVGDEITGMKVFPTQFMDVPQYELNVFQNNACYKILPEFTADTYAPKLYLIANEIGCVSNSAISAAEGKLLIFPDQHGVYAYDRREPIPISDLIKPIFEGWNPSENVSGIYNHQDGHYYLSYPGTEIPGEQGRVAVTWSDERNSGHADIYAQVLIDYDSLLGSNIVVCEEDDIQDYPDIGSDANGNFVIVWQDNRTGDYDIWGKRFDYNGDSIGGQFQITNVSGENEIYPAIDVDPSGYFAVSWDRDQGTDSIYMSIKVYNPQGESIFEMQRVCDRCDKDCGCCEEYGCESDCCTSPGCCGADNFNLNKPSISYNYLDGAHIVWSDDRHPFETFGIYGNYIPNKGGRTYRCDYVLHDTDTNATEPVCASFYEGGIVTCWTYQRGSFDVYKTGVILVNEDTTNHQQHPRIAADSEDDYVIVWEDHRAGANDPAIYAQRYNSAGAVGSNFVVDDSAGEDQWTPDIAMDAEGNFVVVYDDDRRTPNQGKGDIYLQRFDSSGTAVGYSIMLNDDPLTTKIQDHPRVALSRGPYTVGANAQTLAWNLDHGGWSRESFDASAYCYQHGLEDEDTVKILFAAPSGGVYNYGTQADDESVEVVLSYQSPFFRFSPYPWQRALISYATIESYSDSGQVILSWYADYGTLVAMDTLTVSGYDLQAIDYNGNIEGQNISLKITTDADLFKLAGYYLEYFIDKSRR